MATPFNPNWNPARVMMRGDSSGSPYLTGRAIRPEGGPTTDPVKRTIPPASPTPTGTLGAEAIRATGSGPFDSAFRQNLATYAGGRFQRPGGYLGFNPTGTMFGNPTGGGTDPVLGMPNDLMTMALGGQSFQYSPPDKTKAKNSVAGRPDWADWLQGNRGYGRYFS